MTVQQAITEVFERLGEPSDLPITVNGTFNIAAYGSVRILAALNRAQDYIATYKIPSTPNGRPLHFRGLRHSVTFEVNTYSETLPAQTDTTFKTITFGDAAAPYVPYATNAIVTFDGTNARRIIRVTGAVAVLDRPLASSVAGRVAVVYPTQFNLVSAATRGYFDIVTARVFELLSIVDLGSGAELEYYEGSIDDWPATVGIPSMWAAKSRYNFVLDAGCNEAARSFRLTYFRLPDNEVAATGTFDKIPESFHEAIILWAVHWGHQRMMETTAAYAVKRDFDDLMRTLQTQIDVEDSWIGGDRIIPEVQ
jgi:hypothetical protein